MILVDFQYFKLFETSESMVRFNNIAIGVRVTSGAVLLIVWMDLDALTASQLRKITRVLGLQRVPVDPGNGDINTVRAYEHPSWEMPCVGPTLWIGVGLNRDTLRARYTSGFAELSSNQCI